MSAALAQPLTVKQRTPPFALQLQRLPGKLVHLFAGSQAWAKAPPRHHNKCRNYLLLPPGNSAEAYDWPLKDQFVLIHVYGKFEQSDRAKLAGALLRDGATAGQFLDTGDWFGKLPADSFYWTNKKPA